MDNPQKLITLGTQDSGRRQKKTKQTTQRTKTMSNTDTTKNTTQKTKKMSNTDTTKNTTQKTKKMSNMDTTKNTTQKTKKMSNTGPSCLDCQYGTHI